MNDCTSALKIISTALFSFIFLVAGSQPSRIISYAENQYRAGNYSSALIEYQRGIFFGAEASGGTFMQMGDCCFNLKKYDQAIEYYDRAYFSFQEDSLKFQSLINKSKCNIVTKAYNIALIDLLGITDSLSEDSYRLKQFYIGLCYYGTDQFPMASRYFVDAVHPKFSAQRKEIENLLQNKKLNLPNPATASTLSICFPGLGQFYSGDIKNGLNSLLLSSALLALGVKLGYEQSALDALFTIMPWFQRYYQGGYMRAEKIAIEKRAENRARIYKKVLDQITASK